MCVDPIPCCGTCPECVHDRGVVLTDCRACNGTGFDESDWSGACSRCNGFGMVEDDELDLTDDEMEDYDDG